MVNTSSISKQTLLLSVAAALIIGFLGGVVYSVYRTPADSTSQQPTASQQEATQALASLEKAAQNNPGDYMAWVQLGHAYFDTGQSKQAIDAYTKALALQPGKVDVMTDLGVMYHQDQQHQKALDLFDQVLKIDPQHEQARFNKGVVLLTGLNERDLALAEWKTLVREHPFAMTPSGKMVSDLIEQMEKDEPQKK